MFEEHPSLGVLCWGVVAAFFALMIYALVTAPNCKRGHYEMVHHAAWTQMLVTSIKPMMMVPIYHPAYDAKEWTCDEYCGKNDPAKECK